MNCMFRYGFHSQGCLVMCNQILQRLKTAQKILALSTHINDIHHICQFYGLKIRMLIIFDSICYCQLTDELEHFFGGGESHL